MPPQTPRRGTRTRSLRGHRRRGTPPPSAFPVFIAYGSVPAARDAIERVARLVGAAREQWLLQPMLWRFDQLNQAAWQEMALQDACRARMIVVALSDTDSLNAAAERWLNALTHRHAGAPISALAFVGDDEAWTISLQQVDGPTTAAAPPRLDALARLKPELDATAPPVRVRAA